MSTMPFRWLLLPGILLTGAIAQADNSQDQELPSMELLEFLVDWQTSDGQWVDPQTLNALPEVDQEKSSEQNNAK